MIAYRIKSGNNGNIFGILTPKGQGTRIQKGQGQPAQAGASSRTTAPAASAPKPTQQPAWPRPEKNTVRDKEVNIDGAKKGAAIALTGVVNQRLPQYFYYTMIHVTWNTAFD